MINIVIGKRDFLLNTSDILNDNRDEYYYITPDYRMPIDRWNEIQEELKKHGYI